MKHLLSLFLASALVGPVWGQAPTPPVPSGPTVVFPSIPAPAPIVQPGQATLLQTDQLYVIQSSAPVVVVASPQGVVKITPDVGPLRIRGKFVDGTGIETRTFKGPNIYLVEATGSGNCELIVVPSLDPKAVDRRTLTTEIPAPIPPGPTPNPPAPSNPLPSDKLRVLTVYETADKLTSAQNVVLKSDIPQQAIKAAGGDYMCLDQNNDPTKYTADQWWKDAWKRKPASASPPKIIISSPKGFYEGDIPASVADFTTLLKKY